MLFLSLFGLSSTLGILFVLCIVCVFAFEFINGFHDTANAVATVIYTKSLKPIHAVVWSGIMNFLGVITSYWIFDGMGVAIKIANLLPIEAIVGQDMGHSVSMILAVLVAAMIWNLGTWYFGIPCSSSHTLIGAILGVGLVFSFLPENVSGATINWDKAKEIGSSLLFSPAFGFSMAIVVMFIMRSLLKGKEIFKEPVDDNPPPTWVRGLLITTCTLVSFFHGSNDGQKGVGLAMLVMICFFPMQYALSPTFSPANLEKSLSVLANALPAQSDMTYSSETAKAREVIVDIQKDVTNGKDDVVSRMKIRQRLTLLHKNLKTLLDTQGAITNPDNRNIIKAEIKHHEKYTHYIQPWIIIMISLALGIGTMIGWKRIVVTIGEKIGKKHMTYAEGATAELVAATTIGLASQFNLPVSTTHVLSSGVAGSMVASKGIKNLQKGTIANIALAWVLTLPVTIFLSGALYFLFRMFI